MKEVKEYYRKLDIIRIIACIMVLLYHLNIVKGGYLAVCTFFALSGYLSCLSALKNKNFSIKSYYISRFQRIYVPLVIVVLGTVVIIKQNVNINLLNMKQETASVFFGYNNFWQLSANLDYFARHGNSPFMHLWYISILMQFELIFPIAFVIIRKISKIINRNISTIIVFLLTIASTVAFYQFSKTKDIMFVYYNTLLRSFSIFFGIFLALLHYKYDFKPARLFNHLNKPIFWIYTLVLVVMCFTCDASSKNYAIFMIIATIISVRLIEYATIKPNRKTSFDYFLGSLSKCTYEIYLVQYPVIYFVQRFFVENKFNVAIIIGITLVISYIINIILNIKSKVKLFNFARFLLFNTVFIYGCFLIITEKDTTVEMKELENLLNENLKIVEVRNEEYVNALKEEQDEWNKVLQDMEGEESNIADIVKNLPVVGVGDSVLLGAIDGFYEQFPNGYFDGKVSRNILGGMDVLSDLKNKGMLGNIVILALSTNGDYVEKRNKDLMELLEDRQVYWINSYGADDPKFNDRFKEFAKDYSNLHIVDWYSLASEHLEYLYADKIHVKGSGIKAYAGLVYDTIYQDYLQEYNKKKNEIIQKHEDEKRNKIAFYGNDLLINSFSLLQENFEKSSFNVKSNYDFNSLYNELKEKIDNNTLEYKVVLMFDRNANLSEADYKKIINLCSNYDLYICDTSGKDLIIPFENVTIIDFYSQILEHDNYVLGDKIHLTKKGNQALAEIIKGVIL